MRKKMLLAWLLFFPLAGCAAQDLRSSWSTSLTASITADGCSPNKWIVPSGQTISVLLENAADSPAQWTLLTRIATPSYAAVPTEDQWISLTISAHGSLKTTFVAPAMPAEYQVLCAPIEFVDDTPRSSLIVVIPDNNP